VGCADVSGVAGINAVKKLTFSIEPV